MRLCGSPSMTISSSSFDMSSSAGDIVSTIGFGVARAFALVLSDRCLVSVAGLS